MAKLTILFLVAFVATLALAKVPSNPPQSSGSRPTGSPPTDGSGSGSQPFSPPPDAAYSGKRQVDYSEEPRTDEPWTDEPETTDEEGQGEPGSWTDEPLGGEGDENPWDSQEESSTPGDEPSDEEWPEESNELSTPGDEDRLEDSDEFHDQRFRSEEPNEDGEPDSFEDRHFEKREATHQSGNEEEYGGNEEEMKNEIKPKVVKSRMGRYRHQ